MAGSTYGNLFKITTWGESHGAAVGVVIDGCPAGLPLSEEDIQHYLNRRKPGQSRFTTARQEADQAEILSGVFNERTTGTPISILVKNQDQRSKDYGKIKDCYRPGHADYTFDAKYGFRDYRGGGRSSGRETIGRVAAGAVAAKLLRRLGIEFTTYTRSIGEILVPESEYDFSCIFENELYMPNNAYAEKASAYLGECILLRAAIKPTPSIAQEQETVTSAGDNTTISITGRHDPVIVPRAVVVVESMAALTIADLLMMNMSARLDNLERFYL